MANRLVESVQYERSFGQFLHALSKKKEVCYAHIQNNEIKAWSLVFNETYFCDKGL